MIYSGNRVVFDSDGSYIEDKETDEVIQGKDNGIMHDFKMWARKGDF